MNLQEVNSRLKNHQITEAQLENLTDMYIVLDLDKNMFCKMIDSVDLAPLLCKADYYRYAFKAIDDKMKLDRVIEIKQKLSAKRANINKLNEDILILERELSYL